MTLCPALLKERQYLTTPAYIGDFLRHVRNPDHEISYERLF